MLYNLCHLMYKKEHNGEHALQSRQLAVLLCLSVHEDTTSQIRANFFLKRELLALACDLNLSVINLPVKYHCWSNLNSFTLFLNFGKC